MWVAGCHHFPVGYNDSMKRFATIIFSIFFISFIGATVFFVRADELDDINKQLDELNKSLSSSKAATALNEQELAKLNSQLDAIKVQVAQIETDIKKKELDIRVGDERLKDQKELLDKRIASFYKNRGKQQDALLQLLVTDSLTIFLKQFAYQQTLLDGDRRTIVRIVLLVRDLEEKKKTLEVEKEKLIPIKEAIAKQSDFLSGEVAKSKEYEGQLQQQIVQLTARQQQILAERLASLNIPRSAGTSVRGCTDDRSVDPGFSSAIAFFTYGAPHRNGLNQYGAWGRAKYKAQNEEQILSEYYPGMQLKKDYDQGIQIRTDTGWSGSIEDYVKRIYEVPDSWTDNNLAVLKAQAVAARTYALRSTSNGANTICTTEACQVFKPEPKGGNWEQAVNATAGWVLMDGGGPGFTQYASTHGGYILNLGKFDGDGGNPGSFSELNERAFDKDSPWFYCDWGSRPEYNKTAWLKSEEVADIVNTLLLVKRDSSTAENLYQTDKPNPAGKETWSAERVRSELGSSAITTINDISVSADFGSGKTSTITINGISFSGSEFKDRFNLRAPANLQIVGPLFNVERR